ncbi:MAG TPA: hypothetical protein VKB62_04235 [Streptosporangiaceae bacterium]|nr:hypothetical protein [Streptosporangiaceae bacterium]
MADELDPVRRDVQSLPDTALTIYEAIATLEYCGQRASFSNIASASCLSEPTVERELSEMTRRGLIRVTDENAEDGPVYIPAQRGWSAAPEQGPGHQMS